jgi:hypothetical protein
MSQVVAVRQVPGGRMSTIVYGDLGEEVRRDAGIRGSRATPHLAPRCLPSAQRMTDRPSNMFLRSAGTAVMLGDVLACPGNVGYLVLAPPICCLVSGAPHPVLGRYSSCRTLRWHGLELNVAYAPGLKVARSLAAASGYGRRHCRPDRPPLAGRPAVETLADQSAGALAIRTAGTDANAERIGASLTLDSIGARRGATKALRCRFI